MSFVLLLCNSGRVTIFSSKISAVSETGQYIGPRYDIDLAILLEDVAHTLWTGTESALTLKSH